jgi:ubiquitin-protein ligase
MAQAHPIVEPAAVSLRLNAEAEREWPDGCVAVRVPMGFKVTFTVGECATPYSGGVFHMTVIVSEGYPFRPPTMTFTSPIHHFITKVDRSTVTIKHVVNGGPDQWNPGMSIAVVSYCC